MQPKFPLPLQIPLDHSPIVTQGFGAVNNPIEPAGPNGEPHFHYGIDIVCGSDHDTYGAHIICPTPTLEITEVHLEPEGSKVTPYIMGKYVAQDNTEIFIIFAHIIEAVPLGIYRYGETIAKVGNIGLVSPQPDLKDPYQGAHLHLGVRINGEWVDPIQYFDANQRFIGDSPTRQDQLPATNWLIKELLSIVHSIVS